MIGVFGQTRDEVATLLNNVTINQTRNISNMTIYNVTYNGNTFYVIVTGVGKANAAFAMSYAIFKLCIKKAIVVGNAASFNVTDNPIGSVAIATNSLEWDVDFTALGADEFVLPPNIVGEYPVDVKLQKEALNAANGLGYQVDIGLFASGDTFVDTATEATTIQTETEAEFLDIDTAAIGQISYQTNIPYISVKGISNYPNDTAVVDYNTNKEAANNLSNRVVLEMLDTLFEQEENYCPNQNMNLTISYPCNRCYNNLNIGFGRYPFF